jgi:23S rRNA pseudouridine2605 synthase
MPRDRDKHNDSPRGRLDRPSGKSRSGSARGPEKRFAKRGFGRDEGEKRSFGGGREGRPFRRREEGDAPRREYGDRPRFRRDDRAGEDRNERAFKPRGDRAKFSRDERGERSERKFEDRKFSRERSDRGPRRDFGGRGRDRDHEFEGRDRGELKPWQNRERRSRDDRGEERPRFSRPREDREQGERPPRDRAKFSRPRWDRNEEGRDHREGHRREAEKSHRDRPKFDRPRWDRKGGPGDRDREAGERRDDRRRERPEGRMDWQEHPRSAGRFSDRPRRDNEDDSKIFAKRPAFGGRGAYRERSPDFDKRARPEPKPKKSGERIAKVLARAGLASRRDAEEMVTLGRVSVNGRLINSPALDVTANDVIAVDGNPLPPRERTRLFLYHKPRGLMTTHADPEGRPTVFDNLPEGLPRLISVGRLDFNTEGLLLLTNDGGLARVLELPDTGWLRRYKVRAHGEVTQAQLDELKKGVEVDGVKYGPIEATLERDQGANVWLVFAIREGKNREVRNVMAHLGLEVNRLIRISYGPFQLGELEEGQVEEVKTRVLREQLGEKVARLAGADFTRPEQRASEEADDTPRGDKPFKPSGKSALIADRKGRRVLVQRTGSEEARARNEAEASDWGPPRRPQRAYHGKRDLKPRDE